MNLDNIPFAFQSKLRLSIIAALVDSPKNFTLLQQVTGATAGNIGKQLEVLEQEQYVVSKKSFVNKRPNTTYTLSYIGRQEFLDYVELLNSIIEKANNQNS